MDNFTVLLGTDWSINLEVHEVCVAEIAAVELWLEPTVEHVHLGLWALELLQGWVTCGPSDTDDFITKH